MLIVSEYIELVLYRKTNGERKEDKGEIIAGPRVSTSSHLRQEVRVQKV